MKDEIKSYLSFRIGTEYYAANVSFVHNIIEYNDITKVPDMPAYMLGIINLRGQVLPVIDARIKFGIENIEITTNSCILVMEVIIDKEAVFVGTLVDAVAEVVEINKEEIKPSPKIGSKIKNDFILGVYHDTNKFIMILDMNQVFATDEIINMNKLAKKVKV